MTAPKLTDVETVALLAAANVAGLAAAKECALAWGGQKEGDHNFSRDYGGSCGFAWVVIKPGTSRFAKYLVAKKIASRHYNGGVSIWNPLRTQSVHIKQAYSAAYAEVLRNAGFNAVADSRLD